MFQFLTLALPNSVNVAGMSWKVQPICCVDNVQMSQSSKTTCKNWSQQLSDLREKNDIQEPYHVGGRESKPFAARVKCAEGNLLRVAQMRG